MKNKSRIRIILIALLVIVISLSVGFGTWIISNYVNSKPNDPESTANKVITKYLDDTSTTFDGNIQLPIPRKFNNYLELDPKDVTYFYKHANSSEDYTECIENEKGPQNAGEYLIQVKYKFTDTDIFEVSDLKFTINKRTIDDSNTTIAFDDVCTYNSKEQKPTFTATIKFDGKTFILDETNFKTTYSNNINATINAQAVMKSTNDNFDGTITKVFTIYPFDISKNKIKVEVFGNYRYTGKTINPDVAIQANLYDDQYVSLTSSDYTVTGSTNASQSASYTIAGKGNYIGKYNDTFIINKAKPIISTIPTFTAIYEGAFDDGYPEITNARASFNNAPLNGTFEFVRIDGTYYIDGKPYFSNIDGFTATEGQEKNVLYRFVPSDQDNFEIVEVNLEKNSSYLGKILIRSVAYSGSTYFGSIEQALAKISSGTINVIVSIDEGRIIRTNCTVNSGVTLQFLYDKDVTKIVNDDTLYPVRKIDNNRTYAIDLPSKYRKSLIYLGENVTLTNNGIMIIGGIISSGNGGGAPNCQTCDSYAEIQLMNSSSIIVNNKMVNYGAIRDKDNEKGNIQFNSSSNLQMPFIVIEHRGGAIYYGVYKDMKGSAFNRFFFQNIMSSTIFKSGAILKGYVDLYASSRDNETLISIIGTDNNTLINLSSGSYLESYYDNKTRINTVSVYGNMNLNSMTMVLELGFPLGSIELATKSVLFPISWYFNVTLKTLPTSDSATVTLNQNIKIMSGAKIRVETGVTLIATKIIVYNSFYDTSVGNGPYETKYPNGKDIDNGELIVNGILKINSGGSLGGLVQNDKNGAEIQLPSNANTSVTSYELLNYTGSNLLTTVTWKEYKLSFTIYPYSINGTKKAVSGGTGTYYSRDNLWYSTSLSISYDSCGGTEVSNSGNISIDSTGYNISSDDLPTPTREHYNFAGWFYDGDYSIQVFENDVIFTSVTLYAKWDPKPYKINYEAVYANNATANTFDSNNNEYYNVAEKLIFNQATNKQIDANGNIEYELVFIGWYLDKECTNQIDEISSFIGENPTIYALFYPAGTQVLKINYENDLEELPSKNIFSADLPITISIYEAEYNKTDNTKEYYFDGWYTTSDYQENSKLDNNILTSDNFNGETEITLYAKWVRKGKLIIKYKNFETETGYYYYLGETFNLPDITKYSPDNGYIFDGWLSLKGCLINSNNTGQADYSEADYEIIISPNALKILKLTIQTTAWVGDGYVVKKYFTAKISLESGNVVENDSKLNKNYSSSCSNNSIEIDITENTVIIITVDQVKYFKNYSIGNPDKVSSNITTIYGTSPFKFRISSTSGMSTISWDGQKN